MQDLPFASSVGSCHQAAAADLLCTLERLHSRNHSLLDDMRSQILAIMAMERSLALELPNPSLCANAVCTVDLDAADSDASDQILDTLTSAVIAGKDLLAQSSTGRCTELCYMLCCRLQVARLR
jgi:hypothetical protein